MKRLLVLLLSLVVVAGCASPAEKYLAKHPNVDPEIAGMIKEGRIQKGMTREQVLAAWGDPCWYCAGQVKLTYLGSTRETWVYVKGGLAGYSMDNPERSEINFDRKRYVYFENGRVVGWSD